jgi:hypothetical protein
MVVAVAIGLPSSAADKPTSSQKRAAAPGGPVSTPKSFGGNDRNHYWYCDFCYDDKNDVTLESDVFVPPDVLNNDVAGDDYVADISTLPVHGLALGLRRPQCAYPPPGKPSSRTLVIPYQSGPPPPIGAPITGEFGHHHRRSKHYCVPHKSKPVSACSAQVRDGVAELGGILFPEAANKASYIFVPCAYVPLLETADRAGAEKFSAAHSGLTLKCNGNLTVSGYPHEYGSFSCDLTPPGK